jgi:hypothetical protein
MSSIRVKESPNKILTDLQNNGVLSSSTHFHGKFDTNQSIALLSHIETLKNKQDIK